MTKLPPTKHVSPHHGHHNLSQHLIFLSSSSPAADKTQLFLLNIPSQRESCFDEQHMSLSRVKASSLMIMIMIMMLMLRLGVDADADDNDNENDNESWIW